MVNGARTLRFRMRVSLCMKQVVEHQGKGHNNLAKFLLLRRKFPLNLRCEEDELKLLLYIEMHVHIKQ